MHRREARHPLVVPREVPNPLRAPKKNATLPALAPPPQQQGIVDVLALAKAKQPALLQLDRVLHKPIRAVAPAQLLLRAGPARGLPLTRAMRPAPLKRPLFLP